MNLSVLELPHRFGAVSAQLDLLERELQAAQPGDFVVLPELILTGYVSERASFDLSSLAEPLDGPTAQRLSALAQQAKITLCAPLVERSDNRLYNALLVHDACGQRVAHYRKRHPWYPETWASAGDLGHPVLDVGGTRFTFAVCFDLHFVTDDLPDADWLVFPSAWVEDGEEQRQPLLQTLARKRSMGVINANWGIGAPRIATQGRSLIVDVRGAVLGETSRQASGPQWLTYDSRAAQPDTR